MRARTLENWFVKKIAGADRLELTHKGEDGVEPRIVATYPLTGAGKDALAEIAREVLADAQDECSFSEVRCTFILSAREGDRQVNSLPIRCDPIRDDGTVDQDAQEEPTKGGVIALLQRQTRDLGSALLQATSPERQQKSLDLVFDILRAELKAQREENTALRIENAALRAQVDKEEVAAIAELVEEQKQNSELTQLLLGDGLKILGHFAQAAGAGAAAAAAPNGHGAPSTPGEGA